MIEGCCHCGAVRWQFDGVPDSALACSCTVCRRYGTLWAYDYEGERIRILAPPASIFGASAFSVFTSVPIAAASPIGAA